MGENTGIRILTAVGLSGALLAGRGLGPTALVGVYIAVVTLPLIAADVRARRLPNALVLPAYAFAGVAAVWEGLARGSPGEWPAVGAGVLVLSGALAGSGALGMGDAKLAGVLGMALGGVGSVAVWLAAAVATLAVVGAAEWAAGRASRRASGQAVGGREVAFGPILLGSFWAVAVSG